MDNEKYNISNRQDKSYERILIEKEKESQERNRINKIIV